jgi:hypothetical protein
VPFRFSLAGGPVPFRFSLAGGPVPFRFSLAGSMAIGADLGPDPFFHCPLCDAGCQLPDTSGRGQIGLNRPD